MKMILMSAVLLAACGGSGSTTGPGGDYVLPLRISCPTGVAGAPQGCAVYDARGLPVSYAIVWWSLADGSDLTRLVADVHGGVDLPAGSPSRACAVLSGTCTP